MNIPWTFYKPFVSNDFHYERCFLCGIELNENNRTDEHIFPKWLQHKFNLWNQSLKILNHSTITYKRLIIPCCATCNNVHLSLMEQKFEKIFNKDFKELNVHEELIIFQWTAKILYGTLYRELSLKFDIKNPTLGTILSPHHVEQYSNLHLLLQSIRIPTNVSDPKPWSIFVFKYNDDSFNYINDVENLGFSIKLGRIGVTVIFEDGNAIEDYIGLLKKLIIFDLNLAQYLEVSARIFYSKKLATNVSKYIIEYNESSKSLTINTINQLRNRPWDDFEYSEFFDDILERGNLSFVKPIYADGMVKTFLVEKGKPMLEIVKNS